VSELVRSILALPPAASSFADEVDRLHFFVITVTLIGAILTFLVAGYFVLRYRAKHLGPTPRSTAPFLLELGWIVGLMSLFVLWWVLGYRTFVRMESEAPQDAMEIYVTAKQWTWKFAYPDGRSSAAELVVPIGKPVRLLLTSQDVIHSFFVPAFRLKRDVLPGRYTSAWFEATKAGDYPLACAEYCGLAHSLMRARVRVLAPDEFERWLDGETLDPAESMAERGKQVASRHGCLGCHSLDGKLREGPTWLGLYRREVKLADGSTIVADEAYLTESMMEPSTRVVAGFPANMPSFQGVLTAPEVGALVELIKSLEEPDDGAS
jgi:cytochrome c oxidase subunit II